MEKKIKKELSKKERQCCSGGITGPNGHAEDGLCGQSVNLYNGQCINSELMRTMLSICKTCKYW